MLGNKIYQLTYLSNKVLVYNNKSQLVNSFKIPFQDRGLTNSEKSLMISNRTSALIYISPITHKMLRFMILSLPQPAITHINDLQFHDGMIYANIFQTNLIVVALSSNGKVIGWINIVGINKDDNNLKLGCVANGIIFVGGEYWTQLYEIMINLT